MDGIRVVRVKTYIAANRGVVRRTLDFLSFLATGTIGALHEPKPDVVTATSPQFFAAVAGWLVGRLKGRPFVFELGDLWPVSIEAVGAMKRGPAIRTLEKLELFLYRRSAAVIALTHSFKRNLTGRGIAPEKIARDRQRRRPQAATGRGTATGSLPGNGGWRASSSSAMSAPTAWPTASVMCSTRRSFWRRRTGSGYSSPGPAPNATR